MSPKMKETLENFIRVVRQESDSDATLFELSTEFSGARSASERGTSDVE